ncbi:lysophospholipid acyltransferase family protein [Dyadobacter sandarakinus]|uniref:Lysophospholipid acyltransferase family protein n=1 Tax=Dyadobacter sandarakinus TaxID=2747268 RepID=A0ABX7IDR1_9BACT|nr:lysophospholipid acyltransferase family protein [Dyadobacter sandarakinus]QRR03838.1 lysophospholipid acyltransferase family protein [Dyadobacter sandarakinus]
MQSLITRLFLRLLNSVSRLSWKNLYYASDIFRFFAFDVFQYRKKVIHTNLKNSFPLSSEKTIHTIARKFYRNFADIIFETIKLRSVSKTDLLGRCELDPALLDYYHEKKQSVVVVAGHLGNWEMINLFAAARISYQMVIVYHELANEVAEAWIKDIRTRFGTEMVPMRDAISQALIPRSEPIIYILINDQSPAPAKAYWTTFLNQDTGVFRGGELIARKLNCPVLYMGVQRDEYSRGRYHIHLSLVTDNPRDVPMNGILEKQIKFLEKDITDQPDNWLWSHRRWKHARPHRLLPSQQLQELKSE